LTICLVAASAGAAALATGAILDQSGTTIQACAQKSHGLLRVVNSSSDCLPSENPISWNQQGPPGTPGSALAFAHVEAEVLDTSRSKNVVSMVKKQQFSANFFCFALSVTATNAIVSSEELRIGGGPMPSVTVQGTQHMGFTPCDPGTSVAVEFSPGSGPFAPPASFYLAVN
jgi:hypothetical protein